MLVLLVLKTGSIYTASWSLKSEANQRAKLSSYGSCWEKSAATFVNALLLSLWVQTHMLGLTAVP